METALEILKYIGIAIGGGFALLSFDYFFGKYIRSKVTGKKMYRHTATKGWQRGQEETSWHTDDQSAVQERPRWANRTERNYPDYKKL